MSITEIKSSHPVWPDLAEAWERRQIAVALVQRNMKLRYMQTALGGVGIVVQPLLLTGMLSLVFGLLLSLPSDHVPYPLFVFSGVFLWSGFQRCVNETGVSLAGSGSLILKVYFPRILIPISSALTALADTLPAYAIVLLISVLYGEWSGWRVVASPLIIMMLMTMAFAIGLWMTIVDVVFRDARIIVPSLLQLVFFATPIMYSEEVVPKQWAVLYHLNPLVGLVRAFRWTAMANIDAPNWYDLLWSGGFTAMILVLGLRFFARLENFAVDRV